MTDALDDVPPVAEKRTDSASFRLAAHERADD